MSTGTKTDTEAGSNEPVDNEHNSEDVRKNVKDRLVLPFAIPLIAAAVVALMGISFSRIFLAGGNSGAGEAVAGAVEEASKPYAPMMWATIITIVILLGAAGVSAMKSMRATSFVLLIAGTLLTVTLAGAVLSGAGETKTEAVDFGKPTEADLATVDPANVIDIDALGTNQFQAKEFTAAPGVLRINFIGKGGSHRLKIKDPRFNWFDLAVNAGTQQSGDIIAEPGKYYVFCPIPGHEEAGMFANIVVK